MEKLCCVKIQHSHDPFHQCKCAFIYEDSFQLSKLCVCGVCGGVCVYHVGIQISMCPVYKVERRGIEVDGSIHLLSKFKI